MAEQHRFMSLFSVDVTVLHEHTRLAKYLFCILKLQ